MHFVLLHIVWQDHSIYPMTSMLIEIFFGLFAGTKVKHAKKSLKKMAQKSKRMPRKQPLSANVPRIMKTTPMTYQYITTVVGPGKVTINDCVYEYHFKAQGVTFWQCHKAPACKAEIITKGNQAWIMEAEHSH